MDHDLRQRMRAELGLLLEQERKPLTVMCEQRLLLVDRFLVERHRRPPTDT